MQGVTELPERLCSREGKVVMDFFFVIWNQMHIGIMPWINELVNFH